MAMMPPTVGLADLPYRVPRPATALYARPVETLAKLTGPTRRVDIAALRADGSEWLTQMRIPQHPVFDGAFSAFGRGTLIATPHGETAIEDLSPGDDVITGSGTTARVVWIGACSFGPSEDSRRPRIMRVMADAFGMARPHGFVTLGASARLLQTPIALRGQMGPASLLTPIAQFADGDAVIDLTPPTHVHLYHVMLDHHATIRASGLECETFHPGSAVLRAQPRSLRLRFMDMFPLVRDTSDFGQLVFPRAPDVE